MVHDYSRRYSSVIGGRQRVGNRRQQQAGSSSFLLSRALGTIMLLVMVAGVGLSFWLKMRIDADLRELSSRVGRHGELQEEKRNLDGQQRQLYAAEAIADRAAALGLMMPTVDQIRKP
jgi:hypothetical protein